MADVAMASSRRGGTFVDDVGGASSSIFSDWQSDALDQMGCAVLSFLDAEAVVAATGAGAADKATGGGDGDGGDLDYDVFDHETMDLADGFCSVKIEIIQESGSGDVANDDTLKEEKEDEEEDKEDGSTNADDGAGVDVSSTVEEEKSSSAEKDKPVSSAKKREQRCTFCQSTFATQPLLRRHVRKRHFDRVMLLLRAFDADRRAKIRKMLKMIGASRMDEVGGEHDEEFPDDDDDDAPLSRRRRRRRRKARKAAASPVAAKAASGSAGNGRSDSIESSRSTSPASSASCASSSSACPPALAATPKVFLCVKDGDSTLEEKEEEDTPKLTSDPVEVRDSSTDAAFRCSDADVCLDTKDAVTCDKIVRENDSIQQEPQPVHSRESNQEEDKTPQARLPFKVRFKRGLEKDSCVSDDAPTSPPQQNKKPRLEELLDVKAKEETDDNAAIKASPPPPAISTATVFVPMLISNSCLAAAANAAVNVTHNGTKAVTLQPRVYRNNPKPSTGCEKEAQQPKEQMTKSISPLPTEQASITHSFRPWSHNGPPVHASGKPWWRGTNEQAGQQKLGLHRQQQQRKPSETREGAVNARPRPFSAPAQSFDALQSDGGSDCPPPDGAFSSKLSCVPLEKLVQQPRPATVPRVERECGVGAGPVVGWGQPAVAVGMMQSRASHEQQLRSLHQKRMQQMAEAQRQQFALWQQQQHELQQQQRQHQQQRAQHHVMQQQQTQQHPEQGLQNHCVAQRRQFVPVNTTVAGRQPTPAGASPFLVKPSAALLCNFSLMAAAGNRVVSDRHQRLPPQRQQQHPPPPYHQQLVKARASRF